MKILITGANGMLAHEVRERFSEQELILTDLAASEGILALDITDPAAVNAMVSEMQPELIINCAAYTNVDGAETQAELAEKINAEGPRNLARAADATGATLVHISTDYVFGGALPISEEYTEDNPKHPDTVYGKTKLKGEENIVDNSSKYYIFRTAWLYGPAGKNFVDTMIKVADGREEVTVVNDQHGSPTYAKDLAEVIYQAVTKQIPYGIYHATNEGFTTWAEFTEKIYELTGISCKVRGISSAEYEAGKAEKTAPRPKNSQLSKAKLTGAGVKIRNWEEALKDYLKKEEND